MKNALFILAATLVLLGTIFVILAETPEYRKVVSDDGRLTLEGTFVSSEEVAIASVAGSAEQFFTAVIPPIYQFYPPDKRLNEPATLTFQYPAAISAADAVRLRIAFYDEDFGMWHPIDTEVDTAHLAVSASIDHFSKWALLLLDDVARPNFETEIESLIAAAPAGAVGYQAEVGYADIPGDFVIMSGAGKSGGCGGQFRLGTSKMMTSRADQFSDQLEYQIVVLWQIGEGCGERVMIE